MIKFLLTLAAVASVFSLKAQELVWATHAGGTGYANSLSVAVDLWGNVYTTGALRGTVDFDPGPGVFNLTSAGTGGGLDDIFITKQDANGNFVWAKRLGGNSSDAGGKIAVNASGELFITGGFTFTVDFDPGPGVYNLTSNANSDDIFILKLDTAGNFIWAKQIGEVVPFNYYQALFTLIADDTGNLFMSGGFNGSCDLDPGPGVHNVVSTGLEDGFILKVSPAGDLVWAKILEGAGYNHCTGLYLDRQGNLEATGWFTGTTDLDPGPGVYNMSAASAYPNTFVLKLNATGDFLWAKQVGDPGNVQGIVITSDSSGNILLAGTYSGTSDFDPGPGVYNLTTQGLTDAFVLKLDSTGNFNWARRIGNYQDFDWLTTMVVDAPGNVYVTGVADGISDLDPGPGTFNVNGTPAATYLVKLDTAGGFVGGGLIGAGSLSYSRGLVYSRGKLYGTGFFEGSGDFDPGAGTYNMTALGPNDAYVVKFDLGCAMVASSTVTPVACHGDSATVVIAATGGIAPYTGTGTFVVPAGAHSFVVTDAIGCRDTLSLMLNEPAAIVAGVVVDTPVVCNGGAAALTVTVTGGTPPYTGTGMVTATAGWHSFIVTDASGCSGSDTLTITEPSAVMANAITVTDIECNGGTAIVVVDATGGTGAYAGVDTFTAGAGLHHYIVTDASGCVDTASLQLTEPPAVNVAVSVSGNTLTAALAGAAYQWIDCNGNTVINNATGQAYAATADGSYAVVVTVGACSDTSVCIPVVITGIAEGRQVPDIVIFPNPSKGWFTIKTPGSIAVSVYNILGQAVLRKSCMAGTSFIRLDGPTEGIYRVRVQTEHGTRTFPLLIRP
ncbi:T9SS type A sorting domain-containing protein [Taibaiella koreensis]|uniref:T9SS type A sorting domain-containing protein n=1 Tax=Taibaiella koreensis TaxID=1268548 RepID=UPI000E59E14A|nr:T9SS type A sorting domain-containing protein [Taibaiella koreensis]